MNIYEADFDTVIEVCEGNESTAQLLVRCIQSNPGLTELDFEEIAFDFADSLKGYYDPDSGVTEDEHWANNFEWCMDLLNTLNEFEE